MAAPEIRPVFCRQSPTERGVGRVFGPPEIPATLPRTSQLTTCNFVLIICGLVVSEALRYIMCGRLVKTGLIHAALGRLLSMLGCSCFGVTQCPVSNLSLILSECTQYIHCFPEPGFGRNQLCLWLAPYFEAGVYVGSPSSRLMLKHLSKFSASSLVAAKSLRTARSTASPIPLDHGHAPPSFSAFVLLQSSSGKPRTHS